MQIYHVETQDDYDALIQTINKNIDSCQGHIKTIMNENVLDRYLHKKHLAYWNGQIEAYQSVLMQIRLRKLPKGTQIINNSDDVVNSPNHYTQGEYEVIDILEDKLTSDEYMGFLKGNVTKYNFRELYKNQDEDIAKAEFYQKKMKEFVAKGKTIYSRIAKRFTKVTGYEFDSEFIKQLESGELKIVRTDDGSWVNDPTGDIY